MIAASAGVKVMVATKPVDFRKGADGLAALVREQLRHDPFCGTIFVFRSKRADRLKILAWDGSGLVLLWKRLEHNAFRWPPISDGVMRLSASQLAALMDGLDWSRLHARDVAQPTATSWIAALCPHLVECEPTGKMRAVTYSTVRIYG